MVKTYRVAGVLGVLVLAAAPGARADGFLPPNVVCGGSLFRTCASVSLSVATAANQTWARLTITNLSGEYGTDLATFTRIALMNTPTWLRMANTVNVIDGAGNAIAGSTLGWTVEGGGASATMRIRRGNDPLLQPVIAPGQSITFAFRVLPVNTATDPNPSTWDPAATGTEYEIIASRAGVGQSVCTTGSSCLSVSVTPEPVTMTLLATGLLGIGGVGVIRRRRKQA